MDIIQSAIENKRHISRKEALNFQTWQMFTECAVNKKIFLFGISACAGFFFQNYREIKLEGVIDNDEKKQGFHVEDFLWEAGETEYGRFTIAAMELLKQYDSDEIVVLITSTNYYEQIAEKLENAGIKSYFVFLIMEADKRKKTNLETTDVSGWNPKEFASVCCQENIVLNKIVFFSFGTYSDHGKYITEALLKIRRDLDIVWILNDMKEETAPNVRKIYAGNQKRCIYEMETARIWVYNMPVPEYILKRPEQRYIQTKHWAGITLKKFYLDTNGIINTEENAAYWKQDSRKIDYIITGSNFDTESCRRGFDFHKEVIQIGSPRSDAMFHEKEKRKKVYDYYNLSPEKHLLLYAPTYRYDKCSFGQKNPVQKIRSISLDYEGVKDALERRFGGDWYIALRLHPGHENEIRKMNLPECVIDLSGYGDGEETVAACDVLISDYSSIMFEPAFVKKPVFLFAADKKDYIGKEYDLLIDYDTLPFPIAESNRKLIENIKSFQLSDYKNKVDAFMKQYGVFEDGHASGRAAEFICTLLATKPVMRKMRSRNED